MSVRLRIVALLLIISPLGIAQIPGLGKSSEPAAPEARVDPLGRSTPRGAIVGFSRAVDRGDLATATLYLQLKGDQKRNPDALAQALNGLIDRQLHETLGHISDAPDGDVEDGLPVDREHVGPLVIDGASYFITLVRVPGTTEGPIWLVSAETLAEVPAIAGAAGKTWIEQHMPQMLLEHDLMGLTLAHWCVLIALLGGAFGLLWLISVLVARVTRLVLVRDAARRHDWDAWFDATRWPAIVVVTLVLQYVAIPPLGYPLTFRVVYARIGLVILVVAFTWLLKRVLTLAFAHARALVRGKDRASTQSLMLLAERMVKALMFIVAGIAILILLGVDSKTALAGLGVVGVALALGAQKTVENLLGGIFLLSDKALAVGDYCTIGSTSGTVEDVTLRSVRIRTQQQSLVSLPAGSLAQTGIENFATRGKHLILTTLRLRYGTNAAQLKAILAGIRGLLDHDEIIGKGDSYIRLVNFGAAAIELELFAYVLTADSEEFRTRREELLLEIASLVEAEGSALAPTSFIQIDDRAPR